MSPRQRLQYKKTQEITPKDNSRGSGDMILSIGLTCLILTVQSILCWKNLAKINNYKPKKKQQNTDYSKKPVFIEQKSVISEKKYDIYKKYCTRICSSMRG
jgi:hypothetical protein